MRQTTVFLNDFVTKKRVALTFLTTDFDSVEQRWEEESQQLLTLQELDIFEGLTRFSDLTSQHIRVLLAGALVHHSKLTDEERLDVYHPTTGLVNFLVLALTKCLEDATDTRIELMRINRISELEIAFDFSASMDMEFAKPVVTKPEAMANDSPFKVIVNKDL